MAQVHPATAKKNAEAEGAAILYEDEATFRKDPTIYQTWGRLNDQPEVPTTGSKESCKIFGAVNLYTAGFNYREDTVFNSDTHILFLDQLLRSYGNKKVFVISDNASYHKKENVWDFVRQTHGRLRLYFLPPYSPEFNPIERIWHYVRMHSTHNRYFETIEQLVSVLRGTFRSIQHDPNQIRGYLFPFI